jgi:hypothetical protein
MEMDPTNHVTYTPGDTHLPGVRVSCRVIGVHKLLVLNFYPFLQKYIAPHQRDVTLVLATLIQVGGGGERKGRGGGGGGGEVSGFVGGLCV